MEKIGFIGLGVMGKPMAKNLVNSGYNVTVFDINSVCMNELVECGAKQKITPREIAEDTDIIITMLPNSPEVYEVTLGNKGIIEGIKRGSVCIDMSSIEPLVSKEIAAKLLEKGADYLDALSVEASQKLLKEL